MECPAERRDLRIGAMIQQKPHHGKITGICGPEERSLPGEIDPFERARRAQHEAANRNALFRAHIGIGTFVEQRLDQSSTGPRSTPFSKDPLSKSMLRTSTAVHIGVRPYQSLTLIFAPFSIRKRAVAI